MNDPDRVARKDQKLSECYRVFADKVRDVLQRVEGAWFRPRIQEAWRSPQDQQKAYESGHSELRFGLHNVEVLSGLGNETIARLQELNIETRRLLHARTE